MDDLPVRNSLLAPLSGNILRGVDILRGVERAARPMRVWMAMFCVLALNCSSILRSSGADSPDGVQPAVGAAVAGDAADAASDASATPSFRNDIEPILTRFDCNSGGCHGKLAGQNGFRLSLRGYAPEEDYKSLTSDELGRRLNPLAPDRSLLLLKATGMVPHGGGRLFDAGSPAYNTLRAWIAQGAPGLLEEEPRVAQIAASPATLTLAPGERQQLQVTATFSDGQERDVTWLTRFLSNDGNFASVSATGELLARRHGEVSLVVSYQGLVDTVVVTMPYEHAVADDLFAAGSHEVDTHVLAKLRTLNIPPSAECDDVTFLRRVMLDMIGTLPTPDEVRSFLADSSADKREQLVDSLFERPELIDYWALQLGDLLQNRKERDHDVRGMKGVRALHGWLREQVAINRPWDELVREILTATGPSDQQPAVGYYVVTVGEKAAHDSEVADSVAQAFLGTRIGCARCHNHPLERYTQDDYYHFIAFFSQVQLDRKSPAEGPTVLHHASRHRFDLMRRQRNEEKELEKLRTEGAEAKKIEEKQEQLAKLAEEIKQAAADAPAVTQPRTGGRLAPRGLDRTPLDIAPGSDPREQLVDWMTASENRYFAGAVVNRMWKHFFAVGLIEPVDDLRATNPASNQPLFDALCDRFVASKYDLRDLMKHMVTSRTYQRVSDTQPENAADTRFYSHYYAKRLPAEVLLDAIVQATGVADTFQGYPLGTRAVQLPGPQIDSYFLTTFGRSDRVTACACERSGDVTLSQLLHLQNSDNLLQKFKDGAGNLQRWVTSFETAEPLIEQLFLATYSRLPTDEERAAVQAAFEQEERAVAAQDLFWALLNAKEFTFNH
jgi:hypothetical protein